MDQPSRVSRLWTSKRKALIGAGSGALVLGLALPVLGALNGRWIAPAALNPNLVALRDAMGIEAFPKAVSSERMCLPTTLLRTPGASSLEASVPEIFQPGGLQGLASQLDPGQIQQLGVVAWPEIHPQATQARVPILMYHDVLSEPEVFFDLVPEQFEDHLKTLKDNGFTAISLDQLMQHLRTGAPLPEKPVVLSFDDGYAGHYEHVFPLLQKYQMPGVFFVFPGKVDGDIVGRSTLTWDQVKEMAADPLITIASHSVTHPPDLREFNDADLAYEMTESKRRLEEMIGQPVHYFSYPAGHYDERVAQAAADAGYLAAFTMRQNDEQFAGASESLLAVERFGQSNLPRLLRRAWGGESETIPPITVAHPVPPSAARSVLGNQSFDFQTPVERERYEIGSHTLTLISGGRPVTIHANSRYQVPEIVAGTNAVGAVDGGFFSLRYLDSNVMIGPVLSQSSRKFIPGNASENPLLNGRPLVLISPNHVRFASFEASRHNTLAGVYRELPGVTDAFVAAAWLVRDGEAQPEASFGTLFDFNEKRHRAFWGVHRDGHPVIGVTHTMVGSVELGQLLYDAGLRDAVMLDSGASTSLAYEGESLVGYIPRPVPHVVALIPPEANDGSPCPLVLDPSNRTGVARN
ncbi:polysaccharide deacetylase [Leptolyngbya sp. BL0902]|uniref:polysaccharide deacetylase family protein n=1 Tax=Leptolyngbya sp. BL0902 TaxID=1115757 RepID=UPI0018E8C404|nr:polysaccharide deacetylase family protein [Leptolyngbya sp. BL0902]QQE66374.1 polysaccharide deacetylase [Leptolyngbya sp. BL0902]